MKTFSLKNKIFSLIGFCCLFFCSTNYSKAQTWSEVIKLTASDAAMSDLFSHAIDIEGDRAIISSYENDDAGLNSGSAYIFELDGGTWVETQKLTASDASAGDDFGYSVALFGDRVIIGARENDDDGSNSGAAYIFDLEDDTWVETQKLTASDAAVEDRFGISVSLSVDRAIIGAYLNDDDGSNSGAVYVFDLEDDTWVETQKLTASDAAANDQFGFSVSLMGGRACISAPRNDDGGDESGSAYIFDLEDDTWTETQKLTASDAMEDDYFAFSISLDGDRVLIGAYGNDEAAAFGGSAYIFDLEDGTWVESQKLTASDAEASDYFGYSVSLSGNQLIVGAWGSDDDGAVSGSAYIFYLEDGIWEEAQKITASDADGNDAFGKPVAISGYTAIIGAMGNADAGSFTGSAYVFGTCFSLPVITASADLIEVCEGEMVTLTGGGGEGSYSWDGGATDGLAFIPDVGTTTFTVTGEDVVGCENTASIDITVNPLPEVVAIADEIEVCLGDEVTLTGGGATTYTWDGGVTDGETFTPELGTSTFTVTGTDDAECENTASIDITVNPLPEVLATADDTEVCLGDEVTLTGEGATSYVWDGGVTDGEAFTPELGTSTFTVTGTDDNECENTASIEITVNPLPEVVATADDIEVCLGDEVTLTGEGATTYTWDGGATDGVAFTPELGTTTFTITGTDDNECENTASIEIIVYEAIAITYVTTDELFGDDASINITVTGGNPVYIYDWDDDGTGDWDDDEDLTDIPGGTYVVLVEDEAGCSGTETIEVGTQLGIENLSASGISVFPNPTSDNVTIQLDGEFNYSLVAMNGKMLFTVKTVNQAFLDLSEFADGVYFLEILPTAIGTENGREIVKVVKQ